MSDQEIQEGVDQVRKELLYEVFDVKEDEVLVDEPTYLSFTVSITARPFQTDDGVVKQRKPCMVQIDVQRDTAPPMYHMIFGEDTEMEITAENLYTFLFFSMLDYDEQPDSESGPQAIDDMELAQCRSEPVAVRLRGHLINCLHHIERLKRKLPNEIAKLDDCIESANRALYETEQPANEERVCRWDLHQDGSDSAPYYQTACGKRDSSTVFGATFCPYCSLQIDRQAQGWLEIPSFLRRGND